MSGTNRSIAVPTAGHKGRSFFWHPSNFSKSLHFNALGRHVEVVEAGPL